MLRLWKKLLDKRELILELVNKGIRLKYRNSYLGIVWSFFEPLLTISVMVIVFGTLLHHRERSFALYVSCGRLLFGFFSDGSSDACTAMRKNAEIARKVHVPEELYPLTEILWRYVVFLISLLVLIPMMIYSRARVTPHMIRVIPALLCLLVLTVGIGMILCVCNVYFRDIEYIWKVVVLMIMYMSALFYYPDPILDSRWGFLLRLNPVFCVIQIFRSAFMEIRMSTWETVYPFLSSAVLLMLGTAIFRKAKRTMVLYL